MISSNSSPLPSSQPAKRSCSSERSSFGMRSYAASRISMCRKRKASSIASCGRISSLRTSAASCAPGGLCPSGASSASASHSNSSPTTEARSRTVPLLVGKRVEAGGEERLNRRGHVLGVAPFREHREQLLDEERIPFGHLADPGAGVDARAESRRGAPRSAPRTHPRESGSSVSISASAGRPTPGARRAARAARGRAAEAGRRGSSPTRCSIRSSSVGSAQWMSSMTSASGRCRDASLECLPHRPEDLLRRSCRERGGELAPRRRPPGRSRRAASR